MHKRPDMAASHLAFARAHDAHERVTPDLIASMIVDKTPAEALAAIFALGYHAGHRDGVTDTLGRRMAANAEEARAVRHSQAADRCAGRQASG